MTGANTVFLRLEGPLQAWGGGSKFVIRDTDDVPSKSGVLGMICCAMGVRRAQARAALKRLNAMAMGLRIDRSGTRWHDYHTVGAGYGIMSAKGKIKKTDSTGEYETLVSRRYYLCDASFLVALRGTPEVVMEVATALEDPDWMPYLGRKSCPPAVPLLAGAGDFTDLTAALQSQAWRPRFSGDHAPDGASPRSGGEITLDSVLECAVVDGVDLPSDAEPRQDVAISFDPPVHQPRYVLRRQISVAVGEPTQSPCPPPPRPRASYQNTAYRKTRAERMKADHFLCLFCKAPAGTVQHITYRRAGGHETLDDLRTMCRLCHDAVTMIEYGLGMGLDRINPEDPAWRQVMIDKRAEILRWRSLAIRRRHFDPEEV